MATLFLLLIYLAFISLGLPDSLLGSAWPTLRLSMGAPLDAAGLVSITITLGTVISSLLSERIIRRFGTGRATAVSVVATALALLGTSFASGIPFLILMAIPLGLGAGTVDAGLNNYVALHYTPLHMNWLHCFWGVGASMGPLILGVFLRQSGNWRGGYMSISAIQGAVALLLLISLPLWRKVEGHRPLDKTDAHAERQAPGGGAPPSPAAVIRIPGVTAVLLCFGLYCAFETGVGLWAASYLTEIRGFAKAEAASGSSLYFIGITVGRFLSGVLSTRISSKALIRGGIAGTLAAALLAALPLPGEFTLAAMLLAGLSSAPIFPSMIHETPHRFGAANSQKIIGWQMAAAYTGSCFLPPLIGVVTARIGMGWWPAFLMVFAGGALLASERVNAAVMKTKNKGEAC